MDATTRNHLIRAITDRTPGHDGIDAQDAAALALLDLTATADRIADALDIMADALAASQGWTRN